MEVRQISVFLENKAGQLAQICRILADAQIDMKALNIAETSDYGVLRLITDKPQQEEPGFICTRYTELLEVTIRRAPAFWLWSHRRWKHKVVL